MRLEAEEAERAPLSSLAREEILARCNVGTSRGIVPETRSVSNSIQRYHVVSHALTVRRVECRDAWLSTLTKEEKLYGHHFSQAAWAGARICAYQSSEVTTMTSVYCMDQFCFQANLYVSSMSITLLRSEVCQLYVVRKLLRTCYLLSDLSVSLLSVA
jgi:hypothetical protein